MLHTVQFVGLLTCTFRATQRSLPAFSGFPNDLLSQKGRGLRAYSTAARPPCSGFAPDSLVQRNKNACPSKFFWVAHLPQNKPVFYLYHPNGWLSLFAQCRPGAIGGIEIGKLPPKAQSGGIPCKVRAGGYTHFIKLCYAFSSDSFFFTACCIRRFSARIFFSALRLR